MLKMMMIVYGDDRASFRAATASGLMHGKITTLRRAPSRENIHTRRNGLQDCMYTIMNAFELPADACRELDEDGFTIIPGPVPPGDPVELSAAYDAVIDTADPNDVKVGSSTTRVRDFVNRGPVFDGLYLHPPVLKACCRTINEPFMLSTLHARTLRPNRPAQNLHVDFERDVRGWTMIGFIFMVDAFRSENGATRFVPGSHRWPAVPPEFALGDFQADYPGQVLACGPAGSMIVFNGSVWHGHTANREDKPRRSIQGAYIRRGAASGEDLPARMLAETLSRISPLAKYLVATTQSGGGIPQTPAGVEPLPLRVP